MLDRCVRGGGRGCKGHGDGGGGGAGARSGAGGHGPGGGENGPGPGGGGGGARGQLQFAVLQLLDDVLNFLVVVLARLGCLGRLGGDVGALGDAGALAHALHLERAVVLFLEQDKRHLRIGARTSASSVLGNCTQIYTYFK